MGERETVVSFAKGSLMQAGSVTIVLHFLDDEEIGRLMECAKDQGFSPPTYVSAPDKGRDMRRYTVTGRGLTAAELATLLDLSGFLPEKKRATGGKL